jgi:hypothetical protein
MARKNVSKKNRRSKRRQRGGRSNGFHVAVPRPIFARPLPNELSVSLLSTSYYARAASATYTKYNYGLMELLGAAPGYSAQLYQLYKYARVTAVSIHIEIQNELNPSLILAMGTVPYSDISALTINELSQVPKAVNRTVGPLSGLSRCVVNHTYDPFNVYGQRVNTNSFFMSYSQSIASIPLDQLSPLITIMVGPADGSSSVSWNATISARYHLQYFDLFSLNA